MQYGRNLKCTCPIWVHSLIRRPPVKWQNVLRYAAWWLLAMDKASRPRRVFAGTFSIDGKKHSNYISIYAIPLTMNAIAPRREVGERQRENNRQKCFSIVYGISSIFTTVSIRLIDVIADWYACRWHLKFKCALFVAWKDCQMCEITSRNHFTGKSGGKRYNVEWHGNFESATPSSRRTSQMLDESVKSLQ